MKKAGVGILVLVACSNEDWNAKEVATVAKVDSDIRELCDQGIANACYSFSKTIELPESPPCIASVER